MKSFPLEINYKQKGWGKHWCFLGKCVFSNCLMFVFIEKLSKQNNFIFWILKTMYRGSGCCWVIQADHSEVTNILCLQGYTCHVPGPGPQSFRISNLFWSAHQEFIIGSHKAGHPFITFIGNAISNIEWWFINLQWKIQMSVSPEFSSWPSQSFFSF